MLITSTIIVLPQAVILIILSLIISSLGKLWSTRSCHFERSGLDRLSGNSAESRNLLLVLLDLIRVSLVAFLIARFPFAVAARSPSSFRSTPQPAVSQSAQVHT
jgi:hypothetical protein